MGARLTVLLKSIWTALCLGDTPGFFQRGIGVRARGLSASFQPCDKGEHWLSWSSTETPNDEG